MQLSLSMSNYLANKSLKIDVVLWVNNRLPSPSYLTMHSHNHFVIS